MCSSRWSSHPTQLSSVPGRVVVLYSQSGVVGVAGQPQIYCFFTRAQVWGEGECTIRVGEDVRINARLVPSTNRHEVVPYLATTVWREGCELPSALSLRLLSPHTPDELENYQVTVPGLVGLLPDTEEDPIDGVEVDRLGSVLAMQGIIAKPRVREKEGGGKTDKYLKVKRDRNPGIESQITVEPEKEKKKRLKSSSEDEPIKHLDCLHKINDIIAELEKKVATEPLKSSNPPKPAPPAQPVAISYPQPGIAYSLSPPRNKSTSPHHIGFPNPIKVNTAPAWLGLTVAPGSVSTAINPISNPLVPATEQQASIAAMHLAQCTGDISDEDDQSPVKKSLFTDIFAHERPRSPEYDTQPILASCSTGRSDTRGGLGVKLSNLLQDKILNRERGNQSEKRGKKNRIDVSREKTTSQSRSRSREIRDRKKHVRRTRSSSSSQEKDTGKNLSRLSKKSRSHRNNNKDEGNSRYSVRRSSSVKKRHSRSPSPTRKKNSRRKQSRSASSENRSSPIKIRHKRNKRSRSKNRKRSRSIKRSDDTKRRNKSRSSSRRRQKSRSRSPSRQRETVRRKKENDNKSKKDGRGTSKINRSKSKDQRPRQEKSRSRSKTTERKSKKKKRRKFENNSEDKVDNDTNDLRKYIEKLKNKNNSEQDKNDLNLNTTVSDNDTDASEDEKIIRRRRLNRSKFLAAFKDDKEALHEINSNKIETDKIDDENVPIAFFEQAVETVEDSDARNAPVVFFDAEVLHDGTNSHVLQLGAFAAVQDKKFCFFKYMQPNLLQSDQLELLTIESKFEIMDCLRLKTSKFDVTHSGKLNLYFKHPELGNIPAEKERDVLLSFISFLKSLKSGHPVILVTHRKDTVLPVLFSLLTKHDLLAKFSPLVLYCCELVHLAWELHMDHLWQGARYPGLRSVTEFVDRELKWDDGYLPCDKISCLLGSLVDKLREEHKLGNIDRFVEQCGGVGVMDYMTAKYNLVQSASGSREGVDRPDHVEVVRGSDQWGRKERIELNWKEDKAYTKLRNSRRTPIPEPDSVLEDGEQHVRILKPEESNTFSIKTSEISWGVKTYNTFLPPGVSKISPLSTTSLLLRIPALKPRISELVGFPVLVQQNPEFTHCKIIKSTKVLSQPLNSMFPTVEAMFENTTKEEVSLDSKNVNFAVANIKLESRYET